MNFWASTISNVVHKNRIFEVLRISHGFCKVHYGKILKQRGGLD
jgi:hypothetical protein